MLGITPVQTSFKAQKPSVFTKVSEIQKANLQNRFIAAEGREEQNGKYVAGAISTGLVGGLLVIKSALSKAGKKTSGAIGAMLLATSAGLTMYNRAEAKKGAKAEGATAPTEQPEGAQTQEAAQGTPQEATAPAVPQEGQAAAPAAEMPTTIPVVEGQAPVVEMPATPAPAATAAPAKDAAIEAQIAAAEKLAAQGGTPAAKAA